MTGMGVSAVTASTAHREWASRPPDERYTSVDALHEAARARRDRTEERTIETGEFRTQANTNDDLAFEMSGRAATLTHWSFGQLATIPRSGASTRFSTGCGNACGRPSPARYTHDTPYPVVRVNRSPLRRAFQEVTL